MKLLNVTIVLLKRTRQGGLEVARVIANPELAEKVGRPVMGPFCRRLMSVKEIARRDGLSLNKASDKRREQPLLCLADFPDPAAVLNQPGVAERAA